MAEPTTAVVPYTRFPLLPGFLLAASASLHLASAIEGLLGTAVSSGAYFVVGQFLLSLALIRLYDGKWVLQDIRLFFVIFFFLYGGTLPLVVLFGLGGATAGLAGAAFMYGTAFLGFNLVQWWYRQPWTDVPLEVFDRIRPTFLNTLMLVGAIGFIAVYAVALGVEISLTIDRSQVRFLGTQLWVVSMFAINGFVMYMTAGWTRLSRVGKFAVVTLALFFIVFQLAMGNRRDFLPMILFAVGVITTRRKAVIRTWTMIAGFVAFIAMNALAIIRMIIQDPSILVRVSPIQIVVTQNEFVSPIYTLMHYVGADRALRWGMTYFSAPALFIPRSIWPEKPESLSLQFMRDAFGTTGLMGFAYTPVTEAFLNFGWVGPFIVFTILSILMVKLVRNASAHPGLYFIAFALVIDFNRGDSGGTFYAMMVVGGAYTAMMIASRLRWLPRTTARLWPAQASRV